MSLEFVYLKVVTLYLVWLLQHQFRNVIGELCGTDRELDGSTDSICDIVNDSVVEAGMAIVAKLAADPGTWLEFLLKADPLTPTPRKVAGCHDFKFLV